MTLFVHKPSKRCWLIYIEIFSNISITDRTNYSVRITKDNRDHNRQTLFGFAQLNGMFDCMHARKGSILHIPL